MKKLFRPLTALLVCMSLVLPIHALSVEQARELLETHYIDDLPPSALQAQTLDALIGALNDPYTVYLSAEDYQQFLDNINDEKTVGIGVSIQENPRGMLIASVVENTPAQEAGLEPGDVILSANGVALTSSEIATAQLTGEEGTVVTICVQKADGTVVELELIRRAFSVATTVRYGITQDENAGYIICTSFGDETPTHFTEAIQTHNDQVNAWIVDLSGNPGGTSNSGMASAGRFIGSGVMYYLRDGQDRYSYGITTTACPRITEHPAIILTSPHSASSAELFTAAIRDHGVGISIGQPTFGKGIAQLALDSDSYPELFDGDALKVTAYRFFSPEGATNHVIGVLPTLMISMENTFNAALLLCADEPFSAVGNLKLEVGGQRFFISLKQALSSEFRPSFVELLEALPPSAKLWEDNTTNWWIRTTPAKVAARHALSEFTPRTFSDVADHPYADSVNTLTVYYLLAGYGDGTFRPDEAVTRAEFCAMLANVLKVPVNPVQNSQFYDIAPTDWYAGVVHAMYEKGYLAGYGDGSFRPNLPITQQEMVSILAQVAPQLNMSAYHLDMGQPEQNELIPFENYSGWARRSAWLLDRFELDLTPIVPRENTSRALAAELMCGLLRASCLLWE